ncbi:serpin family protein [Oscillatoria salina]|uniref:serpin family protein n=1 Tax=Oscillatoria salina TaxID=331517 RepID=UPI001CCADEE5|nr:serpin family protein [Oscillatoria salina]
MLKLKFGFKLFQEILQAEGDKNLFVSPTSVAIALSMLYNGAAGETQQMMAKKSFFY